MSPVQSNDGSEGTKNDGKGAGGRNASLVYELFVLGELMMGPHYGYKLHEIIQRILGPFQRLSWGTLYPLIRRLEQQGLLVSEIVQQSTSFGEERGSQRKAYHITEAGRERFFALMLDSGEYTRDYADVFVIKLSKFSLLSSAQQRMILQHYRDYLSIQRDYFASGTNRLKANPAIDKQELTYLLQIPDYHIHKCDAELAWVDSKIADLVEEKE
jgi:DNA-binding PadR family transcriptional regulator